MTEHQHLLAAHCDPKGKMWSNLRLFRRQDGFAFIERRSLRDAQLKELKKYAVFSKVTIVPDDEHVLLGVAGFRARAALKNLFAELPDAEKQVVSEGPPPSCGLNIRRSASCLSRMPQPPNASSKHCAAKRSSTTASSGWR